MKALNLYAGIGGNRKLWEDVEVTAVECDQDIADIYSHFFPDDNMIVGNAHEYLLHHYKEFDFIWTSPPCPTHSQIRKCGVNSGRYPAVYPDIRLWEEITLLQHFSKTPWVVENVAIYYDPITPPTFKLDRHWFWSNCYVPVHRFKSCDHEILHINGGNKVVFGFDISGFKAKDKRRLLRNMVNPEVGKFILDSVKNLMVDKPIQNEMFC